MSIQHCHTIHIDESAALVKSIYIYTTDHSESIDFFAKTYARSHYKKSGGALVFKHIWKIHV